MARRVSKRVPPCVKSMGTLCAGHANGLAPSKPCDTTEPDTASCCCAVCGSHRVQYAVWHDPNTETSGEVFGSWNNGDNTFCADCDENGGNPNPDLLDKGEDPKLFAKLRKKFLAQPTTPE